MSAAAVGVVVACESRPVYAWLRAQHTGQPADPLEMVMGFVLAGLICIVACIAPLTAAERRLSAAEG